MWNFFRTKLANKGSYTVNIGDMRLQLQELEEVSSEVQKLRQQELSSYQELNLVLHLQSLSFYLKTIQTELISHYYNAILAGYFCIKKTREVLGIKDFWSIFCHDSEVFVKGSNIYLAFKAVKHKLYRNF